MDPYVKDMSFEEQLTYVEEMVTRREEYVKGVFAECREQIQNRIDSSKGVSNALVLQEATLRKIAERIVAVCESQTRLKTTILAGIPQYENISQKLKDSEELVSGTFNWVRTILVETRLRKPELTITELTEAEEGKVFFLSF